MRHRSQPWGVRITALLAVALAASACGPGAQPGEPSAAPEVRLTGAATPSAAPPVTTSPTAAPTLAGPIAARDAHLVGPVGLLFDKAGNLYVSDCSWTKSYIHRIDPRGTLTTIAGLGANRFGGDGGPATGAYLRCPVGMALGPDGTLYFADHASNRIRHIDAAGIITTVAGSGPDGVDAGSFSGDGGPAVEATLQEPWSVAVDPDGNLFIGDRDSYRIRRVDTHGVITTVAGTGSSAFAGDGGPAAAAGICPLGIAIDEEGDLLIADVCNNRVRKVDREGVITTIAGAGSPFFAGDGGPALKAALVGPGHVAFDARGRVLVQDGLRVRRIDGRGVITTIAGNGTSSTVTDGMAAEDTAFPDLYGLAVDAAGNVYAADGEAYVYRIDTNGIITLFAGAG